MKKWPRAISLAMLGFIAGLLIGSVFGAIGATARDAYVRIDAATGLAFTFAVLGGLIGFMRDRKANRNTEAAD